MQDVRDRATSPRLTLGIDDDARSMLDVFREELGNIGTDVSVFNLLSTSARRVSGFDYLIAQI